MKTSIKKDVAWITENMTNLTNFTHQFWNESNGHIKEIKNETKTFITTIKDAINEVPNLIKYIIFEINKTISDYGESFTLIYKNLLLLGFFQSLSYM